MAFTPMWLQYMTSLAKFQKLAGYGWFLETLQKWLIFIWQGSNNDDLPMGQLVLFCEKNLDASIFIIYKHIIYHSVANWMYFQNIEVSDPLGQPFSRKNGKKSKKSPFFAKDKCAPLKSPEEITIFLRIGHFYETPIFFGRFPISHSLVKWIHFDPCYSSLKSFCEGYQRKWGIRKSEKKMQFFEKIAK